jgi:hypothetical protein
LVQAHHARRRQPQALEVVLVGRQDDDAPLSASFLNHFAHDLCQGIIQASDRLVEQDHLGVGPDASQYCDCSSLANAYPRLINTD